MTRIAAILAACVLSVVVFSSMAYAYGSGFHEDFGSFDESRWSKGDHSLGRSYLDPANVNVLDSNLRIKLPRKSLEGGEILTNELHGHGSYAARMKLPDAAGSITGFFMYKSPDYASEIDIELFNDSSRRVMFSTYAGGSQTHTETMELPFDPTAGYHEYRFYYHEEYARFYVDGELMKEWTTGIPDTPMYLMANAWYPTWLAPEKQNRDEYLLVDYIDYHQAPWPFPGF